MIIFCFSDWRTQKLEVIFEFIEWYNSSNAPIDIALYGGDDLARFCKNGVNEFEKIAALTKLNKLLFVWGNDDYPDEKEGNISKLESNSVINLNSLNQVFDGVTFVGLESPDYGTLHYYYKKSEEVLFDLKNKTRGLSKQEKVVLLSHNPPFGILDFGLRYSNAHIGLKEINEFLPLFDFVVCGHVHSHGGMISQQDRAQVLNIASMEEQDGRFAVIDTNSGEIKCFTELSIVDGSPLRKLKEFGVNRIRYAKSVGLTRLEDINESNRKLLLGFPGTGRKLVDFWLMQAPLLIKGEFVFNSKLLRSKIGTNFVFYDLESDLSQENIFLVSVYSSSKNEVKQFFYKKNESKLLKDFDEYLSKLDNPVLVSYSNCKLEQRVLLPRAKELGLVNLYRGLRDEVDLGLCIRDLVVGEVPFGGLKALAKKFGYSFATSLDGFEVGRLYTLYLAGDKVVIDWSEIKKYAKDDVLSLKLVVDKILNGD